MLSPEYLIVRWRRGWTVAAAPDQSGVPMAALQEAMPLFPKGAIIDAGIVHHLKETEYSETAFCIALPEDAEAWRKEIAASLEACDAQERWWLGTDVGASAACIFSVFCDDRWRFRAKRAFHAAKGAWPQGADDLGRCIRLLGLFPEWRGRLNEVADKYPAGFWPKIVPLWDELEKASPEKQTEMLRGLTD